ncbi:uncharacterized protein METZ01_LOCUS190886 [marine metagenome]|uniref:Uncharacterized protein n=1 Tax=marine metagenome TaxID=408172 RepID=A0A382DJ17_9ZZZZ
MEVAPQELAQLLKLAGVGASPEPDMPEPEMASEPEVSVMAIPSDDGAPVGGGCGAPEPEHDHGSMRGIIDMLQGGGEEPIEEAPPKDDYENASKEFTGHPVDVIDTYDQYSYEPAKNSGMQRRTNSYGDNPLREEDLIKEYTEFKKKPINEWDWNNKLGNLIGGKGWNTDQELKTAKDAEGPIDREPGAQKDLRLGSKGKRTFMDPQSTTWKNNMKFRPGSLTKQVPNTLANTGVYDVEGPETALPGAQTRSNRQVAARNAQNAQNQTAVANTKGIKPDKGVPQGLLPPTERAKQDRLAAAQASAETGPLGPEGNPTVAQPKIDTDGTISTTDDPVQDMTAYNLPDPNEIANKGKAPVQDMTPYDEDIGNAQELSPSQRLAALKRADIKPQAYNPPDPNEIANKGQVLNPADQAAVPTVATTSGEHNAGDPNEIVNKGQDPAGMGIQPAGEFDRKISPKADELRSDFDADDITKVNTKVEPEPVPDMSTISKNAEILPADNFNSFNDAFAHYRDKLGPKKKFQWKNPKTGKVEWFTTNRADDNLKDSVDVGLGRNINRLKFLAGI